MQNRPTLSSVAKEAGVSIPTVSQVLRGTGRISEQTREKVLQTAKKLHYVPDSRAASIRSGENKEIGFVINQLMNPFNAEVVSGVVELLEADGYLVSVLDTRDDETRQTRQLETFIRNGRGGLLWVPAMETPVETVEMLRVQGTPTVSFLRPIADGFDHVGILDRDATKKATQHLVDLGHKKIAYLGGTDMTIVRSERVAGYEETMRACGLKTHVVWPSDDNKRAGMQAMTELHSKHPEITGVVCNGDMVAMGACIALVRLGMRPGLDVSIVGFDDIDDAAVAVPALTTMAVSPRKLGRKLASVLLARLQNPEMPVTTTNVSAELVLRDTTAPPN